MYLYRIVNTGHNSQRYGLCEICKKSVSEVWYQVEALSYLNSCKQAGRWTYYKCTNLFGHRACLESQRHKPFKTQNHNDFARTGRLRPFRGKVS